MSKNITDIANWNVEYPFLKEVLNLYNKFDIITDEDIRNSNIYSLCHMILNKNGKNIGEYNNFCSKLLKNLGLYSDETKFYIRSHDRCNILYNWIYNAQEKHDIPDQIINDCFDEYFQIGRAMNYGYKCSFDTYNKLYVEPINITLLDIFNDKMPTIETTLKDRDILISARGRKYVCECVKIYKHMNDKYCLKGIENIEDYSSTCSKLEKFKDSYMWYLYKNDDLSPIIPSLDNIDNDLLVKCRKHENRLQLHSDIREAQDSNTGYSSSAHTEGQRHFLGEDTSITHGNIDSPMKKTITTTIGTFAGASSLLAFLYKFTPAGRLVNPKLRTTRAINNNFYGDGANGIIFDGNEHNELNSYNIGYEAV